MCPECVYSVLVEMKIFLKLTIELKTQLIFRKYDPKNTLRFVFRIPTVSVITSRVLGSNQMTTAVCNKENGALRSAPARIHSDVDGSLKKGIA